MKEMKRLLALILCFVMLVGVVPVGALAAEAETTAPSEVVAEPQPVEAAAGEDDAAAIEDVTPAEDVTPEEEVTPDEDAAPEEEVTPDEDAAPEEEVTPDEDAASEEDVIPDEEAEPVEDELPEEPVLFEPYTVTAAPAAANLGTNQYEVPSEITYTPGDPITVYKLVDEPEVGKQYLIVNSNSTSTNTNVTRYGMNGTGARYTMSLFTDRSEYYTSWDSESNTGTAYTFEDRPYLTAPAGSTPYLWTVGSSESALTFTNGSVELGANYTSNGYYGSYSLVFANATYNTWQYTDNNYLRLYPNNGTDTYLRYSNGWEVNRYATSNESSKVYFYEPETLTKVDVQVSVQGGIYTLYAPDVYQADTVVNVQIAHDVRWSGSDDEKDTHTWTYCSFEVKDDPQKIFAYDEETGTIPTFTRTENGDIVVDTSGNKGTAIVSITYVNEDGNSIWKDVRVSIADLTPAIEITDVDAAPDPIEEDVIVIKGTAAMNKGYPLDYYLFAMETEEAIPVEGTITWTTSAPGIATVTPVTDDTGVVTGANVAFVGEGVVDITVSYTYTDVDGTQKSVEDTVTFSVSKSDYFLPSDGTDDFPDYPAEGAVRVNKTATAVGSFSQTGVAQVELSMAGVPYDTGEPVDVVIMVDMSNSMNYSQNGIADRVTPAKNATKAALQALVKNEAGEFNDNRVAVYTFSTSVNPNNNGYCNLQNFDQDSLEDMLETIDDWSADGGTRYGLALPYVSNVLEEASKAEGYDRKQFVIFVTDGAPSKAFYYLNDNGTMGTLSDVGNGSENEIKNVKLDTYTEYYTYKMKEAGVDVYSIGVQLPDSATTSVKVIQKLAGTLAETTDGTKEVVDATDTRFSKYSKLVKNDMSELTSMFMDIVGEILQAATNITVNDVVGETYEMILKVPSGVELPAGTELSIEVVEYTLDENKNRADSGTVIEKVVLDDNSKVITDGNGTIISIDADNFTYDAETKTLVWKADKLDIKELAIRYYVYLTGSAEDKAAPGPHPTNEEATVVYTNYLGHECQQTFPVPQLTWKGAQVSYMFYLVNDQGQPVNRAGRVVPFTEAYYVTETVTKSVTWNDIEGVQDMLAEQLVAEQKVPDVYTLYDPNAYYEVRVYQTEGVDKYGENYNYFIIEGSTQAELNALYSVTNASENTTKVFNDKASAIRYDKYGAYSATLKNADGSAFQPVSHNPKHGTEIVSYTPTQVNNIDYAATTVAFAVKWNRALKPDTVVMDYGLDVLINVATNDALECQVTAVRTDAPNNVTINTGTIPDDKRSTESEVKVTLLDDNGAPMMDANNLPIKIGTAKLEPGSNETIRYTMDKQNGTLFKSPAKFYYESSVVYYDSNNHRSTAYMYSEVNVIPATSVYYEDEYVTLKHYELKDNAVADEYGLYGEDQYNTFNGWTVNSNSNSAVQATDRPGIIEGFGDTYDANNEYGMDAAYDSSSLYSMGSSAKVTLTDGMYATAEFDFYGTGFDVISMTSSDTGLIIAEVFNKDGETVKTIIVDTYYGYKYDLYEATYYWDGYHWFLTDKITESTKTQPEGALPQLNPGDAKQEYTITEYLWQPDPTEGCIYQVPIIKVSGLAWDKYDVKITASYNSLLDHNKETVGYDFYLDAIRIYDPMKPETTVGDTTAGKIYVKDNEGYPIYKEVRDIILGKNSFDGVNTDMEGAIFIDDTENYFDPDPDSDGKMIKTYSIEEYANYGPNNEVYLATGQSIAFMLDLSQYTTVADVQIGLKNAMPLSSDNGYENVLVTMSVTDGTATAATTASIASGNSSTDRYYSIGNHVKKGGSVILTFTNSSTAPGTLLSITNLKLTFTEETTFKQGTYTVNREVANTVLNMLNAKNAQEPAEVLPETELEVSVSGNNVKEGANVTVKATTNENVDYLTINGQKVTDYKQNKKTGMRTWTLKVKAEEAGDMDIVVTAYDAEGRELDAATETVQVTEKKSGSVNKVVGQLLDQLFA